MKTTLLIALLSLCQTLPVIAASPDGTAPHSFYLNIDPGVAWMQDVSFRDDSGSGNLKFNPGPKLDVAGGYQFTESLAVEVQAGVLFLFSNNTRFNGFEEVHEDFLQFPIMANLSYQIPHWSSFRPFVGVGIGGVYTALYDDEGIGLNTVGDDFNFGYQGFAGVRYQINQQLALGLEYKFMGTLDHNFGNLHLGETRTHSIAISLSLRF